MHIHVHKHIQTQLVYNRIIAFTRASTEEQGKQLLSLPEYKFISVLSGESLLHFNGLLSD